MVTERNTVFVLGAGASVPYGFPTGNELRTELITRSKEYLQQIIPKQGNQFVGHEARLLESVHQFIQVFEKSSTESIDLFLSRNPKYEEVGKIAIVATMLFKENISKFRHNIEHKDQDWYSYLFSVLTKGITD